MLRFIILILIFVLLISFTRTCKDYHPDRGIILLTFNGYSCQEPNIGRNYWAPSNILEKDRADIIRRVGDYFSLWDVVITTDDSLFYTFPKDHRIRCVITSDTLEISDGIYVYAAGGISSLNSLARGDTSAAIISPPNLRYENKNIADCIAHETGHQLGLEHFPEFGMNIFGKVIVIDEYNKGNPLIAPIMGSSYWSQKAVWSKGLNRNFEMQDDTLIISKTFRRLSINELQNIQK